MAKTIDDFVEKWNEYEGTKRAIAMHKEDPDNEEIYNLAVKKAESALGMHITSEDERLDSYAIKRILNQWGVQAKTEATEYADQHLKSILGGTELGKLEEIALGAIRPQVIGEKNHDEIAEIHKKYLECVEIYNSSQSENREDAKRAHAMMTSENGIGKLIKDRLKKMDNAAGLSEEDGKKNGSMSWYDTLMFIIRRDPRQGARIYAQAAGVYKEEFKKAVGKAGLVDYTMENIADLKTEEREPIYRYLSSANAPKKKAA